MEKGPNLICYNFVFQTPNAMMHVNSITVYLFILTLICLSKCDRQVTFTCDGDGGTAMRGKPGAPGKRGPIGNPGPAGPMGSTADLTALEKMVRQLNQSLMELRGRILPSKCKINFKHGCHSYLGKIY